MKIQEALGERMSNQEVIDELKAVILRSDRKDIVTNVMAIFLRILLTQGPETVERLFATLDRSDLFQVSMSAWTALRHLAYEVTDHHVELAVELRRKTELSTVTPAQIWRACRDLFPDPVVDWMPRRSAVHKKSA